MHDSSYIKLALPIHNLFNMEEMIKTLTKGIGSELGKPIRMSYYNKKRFVDKALTEFNVSDTVRNLVYDILALTIFHDSIIIPLHGSIHFMDSAKKYGVSQISMGSYKLGKEHNQASDKCVKQFFAILSSFDIDIALLTFSNAKDFVSSTLEVIKKWSDK